MIEKFMFDDKEVELKVSGATPLRYRMTFKEDILKVMMPKDDVAESASETTEAAIKLAYIMSCQAAGAEWDKVNMDSFLEWAEQFTLGTFIDNYERIYEFFQESQKETSKVKK